MSSASFSINDVKFRRCGGDECHITVFGQTVGTVARRRDVADPGGGWFYAAHLYDDRRGPKLIDRRDAVRGTIARMLIERDLVPWTPPPVHPEFIERRQRHA